MHARLRISDNDIQTSLSTGKAHNLPWFSSETLALYKSLTYLPETYLITSFTAKCLHPQLHKCPFTCWCNLSAVHFMCNKVQWQENYFQHCNFQHSNRVTFLFKYVKQLTIRWLFRDSKTISEIMLYFVWKPLFANIYKYNIITMSSAAINI